MSAEVIWDRPLALPSLRSWLNLEQIWESCFLVNRGICMHECAHVCACMCVCKRWRAGTVQEGLLSPWSPEVFPKSLSPAVTHPRRRTKLFPADCRLC